MASAGLALVCAALVLVAPAARGGATRVARSELRGFGAAGSVFFLRAPASAGAVAVGAAQAFDRTRLAEVGVVAFLAPRGGAPLATSTRYYARPGRSSELPDVGAREDFLVFALDAPPRGVRVLEPSPEPPAPGMRVRIVGLAGGPVPREVEIPATVVESAEDAVAVELDAPADLRGFAGAPVLEAERDRVIGLLLPAWPMGHLRRTSVGPIGGVTEALAEPYEGGIGRLFATLAPRASAANDPSRRRRAATGRPYGDLSPESTLARLNAALDPRVRPPPLPEADILQVVIDVPEPDAVFGESAGAFLAGHTRVRASGSGHFDILIVIDTSESTGAPSDVDVDGDGEVGERAPGTAIGSTDPGDSVLAAEVAAAARLVAGLDPRRTRVGVVSFAGEPMLRSPGDIPRPPVRVAALTREPLTADYERVRASLLELRREGARGMTYMAAGIDLATLELLGLAGAVGSPEPDSTKMILFFTDGQPTLPYLAQEADNVEAVLDAADRARRAGVRIHSFAIGPEALAGPIAAVEAAAITKGTFTPVRDPGRLVESVEEAHFARVEAVEVRNLTTGEPAHEVRLHADASFDALVPLEVGRNRLEVAARASSGLEARVTRLVHYAPGAAGAPLPAELVAKHNALLQRRLLALESDRVEAVRRELVLEIDRERARALERAAEQRKELEIRVLEPGEAGPFPPRSRSGAGTAAAGSAP